MNKLFDKLKQEWERSLLLAVALLTLLVLVLFAYSRLKEDGGSTGQNKSLPAMPKYFDSKSFVYIEPVEKLPDGVNPLVFRKQLAIPDAPPPPKTGGVVKPPAGQAPAAGGAQLPPKASPTEPPWKITLLYRGTYKGLTDSELAFIDATNHKPKKPASRKFYLKEGGRVFNAMTVRSFDAKQAVLSYGKGKEVTIEFGKTKDVTIHE